MGEVSFGHKVICFENAVNVRSMNTNGNTHDHVLGTFSYAAIDAEKVGTFEGFETKTKKRWYEKKDIEKYTH